MQRRSFFAKSLLGAAAAAGSSAFSASAFAAPAGLSKSITDEVIPTAEKPVYLNFNENSLGMAASAKKAVIAGLETGFRYPDADRSQVVEDIAAHYGMKPANVVLGAGSSEVIKAVIDCQIEKARHAGKAVQLVEPVPTFGIAASYAEAFHIPVVDINLVPGTLQVDVPALKKACESFDGISIVYFCNPNNPTSTISPASECNTWIEEAAAKNAPIFFLMDEAYAEFVADPAFVSASELVKKGLSNLCVARTFSKIYALAGLRIGYGLATDAVIGEISNYCSVDNMNFAAAVAASASMKDKAYVELSLEAIKTSRAIVESAFKELGIEYIPSQSNFIFHKVKGASGEYAKAMKERHVIVGREFPPITGWNRLTLGMPGEMKAFVKALKEVRKIGLA